MIAELLRHIDHDRHFVGAVAVVVDEDLAVEHALQRVHREIAIGDIAALFLVLVPLALVFDRFRPGVASERDIAHPGLRHVPLRSIDALGILAAGHLQAIRRAGKLHALRGARRHVLQHYRAAAEEVGRAGQDLQGRDAAVDEGAAEARILRPNAVLGPDFRPDRIRRLVAVG